MTEDTTMDQSGDGRNVSKMSRDVVLVTGCPRSGTTAVGSILASANGAQYLYEPMNFLSGDRAMTRYFETPGSPSFSHEDYADLLDRVRGLKLRLKSGLWPEDSLPRKLVKTLIGGRSRVSLLRCRVTPGLNKVIWKDPIAAFTVRSALEAGVPSLVTYRGPEAIAASFKRLDWKFEISEIAGRVFDAGLCDPFDLPPGADDNSVANAAVLWRLIYDGLTPLAGREHAPVIVENQAIIADPTIAYKSVFAAAGVPFDAAAQKAIAETYANKADVSKKETPTGHAHSQDRNLAAVNTYWSSILSEDEAQLVQGLCKPAEERFRAAYLD